jgi:DNA-binding NarL/FixJ family response regulator/predicted ATPase
VRIVTIVAVFLGGIGLVAYAAMWVFVPVTGEDESIASRIVDDRRELQIVLALSTALVAVLLVTRVIGLPGVGIGTLSLLFSAVCGLAVWRGASPAERRRLAERLNTTPTAVGGPTTWRRRAARIAVGAVLVVVGVAELSRAGSLTGAALGVVVGTALFLGGFLVLFAPWWVRTLRDLTTERRERVRAQERADMAAHVHDSVLQTLSLIQKAAGDAQEVVRLARREERELRLWLFDPERLGRRGRQPETLADAVAAVEREVEDNYGVGVELIVVGDAAMDETLAALLAGLGLRRGRAHGRVRLRPRPRRGLRPGRGARGPPGHRLLHRRAHGTGRRQRGPPQRPRRGHGGRAAPAPRRAHPVTATDPKTDPATDDGRLRVFVVDDHALVRSGIRAELGDAVDVVGEADEAGAAVELVLERRPDVVLLDVHMPGGGGRAVLEQVLAQAPGIHFLALSMSDAAEDVIDVIRAGARGYVTKHISGPDLVEAIRRVADGDAVFSPRLAGFVLDAFSDPSQGAVAAPAIDPELDQLTPRERQVLRLIARGYAYKEIATELGISVKTVESHVSAVLRKLQLANRYQLTNWAAERRMV